MARFAENGNEVTAIHSTANSDNSIMPESEEISDLDDPALPPIGFRNGKWWYSTIHNVTAIVGAGVLALPTAMVYLGWAGGTFFLVVSWAITLFTLWQMVEMHENLPGMLPGERVTTYVELGRKAFGKRLGLWIVLPQQLIVQVGTDIVYTVTGGQCAWLFYQLIHCNVDPVSLGEEQCCGRIGRTAFTIFFALPQFILSQLGSFDSIASLSLLSSIMAVGYSTIAWSDSIKLGRRNHRALPPSLQPMNICKTSYDFPHTSTAGQVFGAFRALGIVGFAYAGHNVALEIQSTLPSTRTKPSKDLMWKGVKWAYAIVAFCYFPVAFAGYWAFGNYLAILGTSHDNPSGGNILLKLGEPKWLIAFANLMVVIHLTGSYQAIGVFDTMEKVLVGKFGFRSTPMIRIVTRSIYVLFTLFIACTFPFFNDLLAFFGGLAITPNSYFSLILIGGLLTILGIIGGFWYLIVDKQTIQNSKHLNSYYKCSRTCDFPRHCNLTNWNVNPSGGYTFYKFKCNSTGIENSNSSRCHVTF